MVCSAPSSCHYCGTNPGFDFLLVSLTWFKPGERLSVANGWMCQYPWGKNTGFSVGSRTGGKLTCHNSKTARSLFGVSVLWSAPSSSRYRGSNRSSSHCRGANPGFDFLLESLSCCLPIPHSCRYCGTNPGFDFLLESLTWFKPGERLSLANGWMCQYPYGKNTDVSRGTNRGESNVIHVSQPLLESLSWCQPLLVSLSMAQTRVATPWCEVQPLGSTPWCEVQPLVS